MNWNLEELDTVEDLMETFGIWEYFLPEVEAEGGGFKLFGWEELNDLEREETLYSEENAEEIKERLINILPKCVIEKGDEELLDVELSNCGLCFSIPPITIEGWREVNYILKRVLFTEDYLSLDWELCWADGYSVEVV